MELNGSSVVVAGGAGNVGGFVVAALLERGAKVAVPSRSERKLDELRSFLGRRVGGGALARLTTVVGDLSDESQAERVRRRIREAVGRPTGVLASLGDWRSAPSLLSAAPEDLEVVLQGYLLAHYRVARALLPELEETGGSYVLINGPLAFDVWRGNGSAFMSIATAGQHMLFRALAAELDGSGIRVNELVTHAFIRNRTNQPGSPLTGEDVGAYAAGLLAGQGGFHGRSIQLRSAEQLDELAAGVQPR